MTLNKLGIGHLVYFTKKKIVVTTLVATVSRYEFSFICQCVFHLFGCCYWYRVVVVYFLSLHLVEFLIECPVSLGICGKSYM